MKVYDRIRQRRIELNMSQEELAQKMGYKTRSAINKIETGRRNINQSQLENFAEALQTTVAYLQGYISNSTIQTIDLNKIIERANELREKANWAKQIMDGVGFLDIPDDMLSTEITLADQELINTVHLICGMSDLEINEAILSGKLKEIYDPRKIKIVQEFIQDNEKTLKKMIDTIE